MPAWKCSLTGLATVVLVVCPFTLSVCVQAYCKCNQPISLTADITTGLGWAYQFKELINFWWWSGPDIDSRSLFHFPHNCNTHDLLAFLIHDTHSAKWLTPTRYFIHNIMGVIPQISGSKSGLIRQIWFKCRITFGWNYALAEICPLWPVYRHVWIQWRCQDFAPGRARSRNHWYLYVNIIN